MAQEMINRYKQLFNDLPCKNSVGCQTNGLELSILLSPKKLLKFYYSDVYKDMILSFELISSKKKFIITKDMWEIILQNFDTINKGFNSFKN